MIVRCERCETRFKLDESRLPARGARVRCSRCKHAFFVIPPGSSREELAHDVAAATAAAPNPSSRAPGPTWDLEDGSSAPAPSKADARPNGAAASATPAVEPEEDNDWRFEDDLPGIDAAETSASLDLTGSAPASAFLAPPDANEDSFADLGDPETWDLLANDAPAPEATPAPESPAAESAPPVAAPVAAISASAPKPVAREVAAAAAPAASVSSPGPSATATRPTSPPATARLTPTAHAAGWAAAIALCAGVAWASLSAPRSTPVAPAVVAGFDVTDTRARIVDNAAAGPVLVVSGRLRNPGAAARALGAPLHVELLDPAGIPLVGASALAGPALSMRRVREEAPERLRAAQAAGAAEFARQTVAAGGELRFDAVVGPLPRAAASVVLDVRDLAPGSGR